MRRSCVIAGAIVLACCITVNVPVGVTAVAGESTGDALAPSHRVLAFAQQTMAAMLSENDAFDQPSGFLLGSPVGLTSANDAHIRVHSAGFGNSWSPGLAKEFHEFTQQHTAGFQSDQSPILAMSLGIDVIEIRISELQSPTELDGVVIAGSESVAVASVSTHGWMAFQFSVDALDPDPTSYPDGSAAGDILAANAKGELQRTVFSYLVPKSTAVMLPHEWQSVRAMDPAAIGLVDPTEEIHGLNMHMALYGTDLASQATFFTRSLPVSPTLYFTVRPQFLAQVGAAAVASAWSLPGTPAPDSGTIYQSTLNRSTGTWSTPVVYRRWNALKIDAQEGAPPVIDGLAIDTQPDANGNKSGDEILYSLASAPNAPVTAADQIMYVNLQDPKPRRVVVQPNGVPGYVSLGRHMRAGRFLGDFCTKDPWPTGRQIEPLVLDDFFVARRIAPEGAYSWPPTIEIGPGAWFTAWAGGPGGAMHPAIPVPPPVPAPVPGDRGPFPFDRDRLLRDLVLIQSTPVLAHPRSPFAIVVPELGLATAGYRQQSVAGAPVMLTCMSWPRPVATEGRATVQWGVVDDYLNPAGHITWAAIDTDFAYSGRPLTAEREIPNGGVLAAGTKKAFAARWTLRAAGRTYISPIALLRF